ASSAVLASDTDTPAASSALSSGTAVSRSASVITTWADISMLRLAGQQPDGVVHQGIEDREAVAHPAGRTGEIDDQRPATVPGQPATQRRGGHLLPALRPDRLGDPRRLALQHRPGGLGGDVARSQAGPAGRDDQFCDTLIAPTGKVCRDVQRFVGHHLQRRDAVAAAARPLRDQLSGGVLAGAGRHAIGDHQHRHPHVATWLNGIRVTTASQWRPLWAIRSAVPGVSEPRGTAVWPMMPERGDTPIERTRSTGWPLSCTTAPTGGVLTPGTLKPTRRRSAPVRLRSANATSPGNRVPLFS